MIKQVQALIDEIDRNPNLTDKEKQALKDRINQNTSTRS
ncbi:DUF1542 domain-containing protein [Staphylococcus aureus]|nr:DUF1542 domain-containing protein [Staphylococcus aureus]